MNIDWKSDETLVIANDRLQKNQIGRIQTCLQSLEGQFPGHIWIATSGTSAVVKWAALSKQAILTSADAVNKHLNATSADVWINPLPLFHVGGLGIWARAHQAGAQCIPFSEKWNPQAFSERLNACQATLGSVVPTMVHDLVANGITPPKSLRALIVGGARLSDVLYDQAIALGWPLLLSYGMTECSSQVATAELHSRNKRMRLLSHVEGCITPAGLIAIKSPSLLTAYAHISADDFYITDPKAGSWFITNDRGALEGEYLIPFGRKDDMVKIGGENVDLAHLEQILEGLKTHQDMALIPMPDARLDTAIHLCASLTLQNHQNVYSLVDSFNSMVMPYERIRKVYYVESFPRTELGKIKRADLIEVIKTKLN